MKIQVFVRQVYGKPLVYPACASAEKFARLLGVKSFSHSQLQQIEGLGYLIEQVADVALAARVAA